MLTENQINKVLRFVSTYCKVPLDKVLNGKKSGSAITEAKRLISIILFYECNITQQSIATILKLKDHTSIINHLHNHNNYLQTSIAYSERWRIFKAAYDNNFVNVFDKLNNKVIEISKKLTEAEGRLEVVVIILKRNKLLNESDLIISDEITSEF